MRPRYVSWVTLRGCSIADGCVARTRPPYEKNAIFSAWAMRRIGASGSLAAAFGFFRRPLAMMVEPSETSAAGAGAAATVGGGGGGTAVGVAIDATATSAGSTL